MHTVHTLKQPECASSACKIMKRIRCHAAAADAPAAEPGLTAHGDDEALEDGVLYDQHGAARHIQGLGNVSSGSATAARRSSHLAGADCCLLIAAPGWPVRPGSAS